MELGGVSTSKKTLITKIYQDLAICVKYFGILFFFYYSLKILSKVNQFCNNDTFKYKKKLHKIMKILK